MLVPSSGGLVRLQSGSVPVVACRFPPWITDHAASVGRLSWDIFKEVIKRFSIKFRPKFTLLYLHLLVKCSSELVSQVKLFIVQNIALSIVEVSNNCFARFGRSFTRREYTVRVVLPVWTVQIYHMDLFTTHRPEPPTRGQRYRAIQQAFHLIREM